MHPEWHPKKVYESGDRILVEGRVYEAKWWSQGDSPEAAIQGSGLSPWQKLDDAALVKILGEEPTS